jgi:protein transport protein SEC24
VTDSPNVNCDPSYQCSTINAIPNSESLLKKSRLPFALVLAPYRSLKEGDVSFFFKEREMDYIH